MTKFQLLVLHLSTAIVTITGIVFALMKYFLSSDDPFAVANHPLQPWMLALHVVFAPVLVFALGWITSSHIVPKLWNAVGGKRYTGLGAAWIAIPMVLSGYLIQVATGEGFRSAMELAHWVSAGVFAIGYVAHLAVKTRPY